jgi:shikimate kinase
VTSPRSPRCIALVGPRAAGKSTLARALGARLGWLVLDTDDLLAARVGMAAGDYLLRAGEPEFRRVEAVVCAHALTRDEPCVVALGGGAVLSEEVRAALRAPDVWTVFLEASVASLWDRQRGVGGRPPLTGFPPVEEIRYVLQQRRALYEEVAVLRINTDSANVDACVALVLDKMRSSS